MSPARTLAARLMRGHTRIAVRLLLFNVLLVFLPVGGMVYLDAYEQHLLDQQERSMVQLGRLLAASLADGPLDPQRAQATLDRLAERTDARLRVIALDRRLLADSHRSSTAEESVAEPYTSEGATSRDTLARAVRGSFLYRVGAALGRQWRRITAGRATFPAPERLVDAEGRMQAPEIARALSAGYGAATRLSPGGQRSVTLYAALPIRQGEITTGVVLVSQSTWRILQRLIDVRLRMFEVVVVSLGLAIVLTAIASFTIVRPLRQLRDDAEALVDGRGRLTRTFRGTRRSDEIGELARALETLTARLDAHLRFTERFAADVSHEFRNPLASIRASADTLHELDGGGAQAPFLDRIRQDIRRLETLLAGVRDVTLVDARLDEEPREPIALDRLMADLTSSRRMPVEVTVRGGPLIVDGTADRLAQVLTNLLDNAESFTPPGERIELAGERVADRIVVTVRDRGPGIPEAHRARIFDRFFSYRPAQAEASMHAGLGLAIAQRIVEGHGGTLTAANHPEGGAVFTVVLPSARQG